MNAWKCIESRYTMLGYYDRTVSYDTAWCYRVSAVDRAGNESPMSNMAAAQKLPDDIAPVVHSILPEAESWVSGTRELSIMVSDNHLVTSVEVSLKNREDGSVRQTAGSVQTELSSGTVAFELNTADFANGVYDVYVTAVDAAGNASESLQTVYHISNVSLDEPVLYASAGNWCAQLHYTGVQGTSHVLYRRKIDEEQWQVVTTGAEALMYRDLSVTPSTTWVYRLMVQDRAGNTAYSALSYVKPLPVDDRKPQAAIVTNTSVVEGYETVFNGRESSDNDRVVSWSWDFGDGTPEQQGPVPKHAYDKAGTYYVSLTVADAAGNTDTAKMKVTVLPKDASGKAVVQVTDSAGVPLSGAMVFVNTSDTENDTARTDQNGQVTVMAAPGTYRIALYKEGYVALEQYVEIELHGERHYSFALQGGETVTADFKVRQMTFEEIVAAGIDLNAPENQHVFTVETKLMFTPAVRPEVQAPEEIKLQPAVYLPGNGGGGPSGGGPAGGGASHQGGSGSTAPAEQPQRVYYTMQIVQSISWLKDMYEATLIVYNNAGSQTIVAKDLVADLILPSGISLADTYQGQSLSRKLKDLKGGESDSATWYLRGDAAGSYQLQALMHGTLQPFNEAFACQFESNEFEVTAGQGLVLTIQPEDRAEKGESYYVYYTLTNEGGKEFYNIKTTFGKSHDNSRRFAAKAEGGGQVPVMSAGDGIAVDCLKPGESISGIYKSSVPVEGEKYKDYMALAEYEYDILQGENLGVSVRISPVGSHVRIPDWFYQPADSDNSEADPVNVSTGAFTDSFTALSVQGVNPVSALLQYDSTAAGEPGEFGRGWTHSYEARILDMRDCTVRYYVSPTGYYTFLGSGQDQVKYKEDENHYLEIDPDSIPVEQTFTCLTDRRSGYELKRDKDGTYTLKDSAGTVTCFDKNGNLASITSRDGKKLLVERTGDSFMVEDAESGRKLIYQLGKNHLVSSVKDGNGREAFFYYTEDLCLKQFTNAAGENTYYTYDEKHRLLTAADDENRVYVDNIYDEKGRVTLQKDGLGRETRFSYEENAQDGSLLTKVTTRSGAAKTTLTDAYGNVTCTTNEAGDRTLMTYDADGNQTSVHNANGYDVVYRYDGNGNMTSMENSLMDGSMAETTMTYDSDGSMTGMKNCSGESMSCTYYPDGLVHTVTDQCGNTVAYEYNDCGQVTKETDADGRSISYEYEKGDLVKVTDKNGNVMEYSYNGMGLLETTTIHDGTQDYVSTTLYDDMGRAEYVTDTEGGVTAYTYDCVGNVTSRTDPAGAYTVYAYDANRQMVRETVYPSEDSDTPSTDTRYSYTKEGLLWKVEDMAGEENSRTAVENSYDATGNLTKKVERREDEKLSETSYEYDKAGNVTKQTKKALEPDGKDLVTEYSYYPNGKLQSLTDEAGKTTTLSYDRCWRVQTEASDTEPSVTYKYDSAGRVEKQILSPWDGKGEDLTTAYTYDRHGRVASETDPAGNRTQYRYDGNGNLVETEDAAGRVFYSRYDALNRVTETGVYVKKEGQADASGQDSGQTGDREETGQDSGQTGDREETSQDNATEKGEDSGRTVLTRISYDIKTHTVTETDAVNGGRIITTYDTSGRPVKTEDGEGNILSETIYDTEGRTLQTVDAGGMVTQNIYNSLMQIETVRRGKKGEKKDGLYVISGEVRETTYAYDGLGRTTGVTDAMEGSATVTFDSLGRLTSMRDPNQNLAAEQLKREGKTPAPQGSKAEDGQTAVPEMSYTYNGNGLLETETNALGNTVSYRYNAQMLLSELTDSAGEKTEYAYDGFGRIREVKDGLGTITYDYDANSNVTDVTETLAGGNKKTIHREFDCLNRMTKYVDYKGREVNYGYDELGNLTVLTYPGGEIVRYTYQGDGLAETMVSQSGGTYTFGYDSYGRLNMITRPDGTVETRGYTPAGRLQSQTEKKGEETLRTTTYTYNVFGEVTEKTAEDADHNLLETVTMEYDDANRLKTYNGQAVTYDAKGNMTYGPVDGVMQALTYDCRNRLTEAGGVSYAYDAENTRISSAKDGRVTEYVTDTAASPSRLLTAYEADGTETRYYYGAEGLSAQYSSGTGEALYYHFDNIGSTLFITGSDGAIVERYAYGTYGELLRGSEKRIRFLFNGSYGVATDENGLYYMRARYYNSDIKRFINQDIKTGGIGDSQSLNRYAYCEGNPVSLVDPFGLSPENAQGQEETSRFEKWHNILDMGGILFDGCDIANGVLYLIEGRPLKAAISFACAAPLIGNFVTGVKCAKAIRKATTTAKIMETCRAVQKLGYTAKNAASSIEAAQKDKTCKTQEDRIKCAAGNMLKSFAMGAAISASAVVLKKAAKKALPVLSTTARKIAEKIGKRFGKSAGKGGSETELFLPDEYYQKLDDNIAKATEARDAEVARIQSLSKTKQRDIVTVVAGVDIRTGEVFAASKNSLIYKGQATCAEDIVFRGLGGNQNANIIMTPAVRPRTGEIIPVCERCQTKYPVNQFVKGTQFKK